MGDEALQTGQAEDMAVAARNRAWDLWGVQTHRTLRTALLSLETDRLTFSKGEFTMLVLYMPRTAPLSL